MERAEGQPVRVAEIVGLIEAGRSESAWSVLKREARATVRASAGREDLVSEMLVRSMHDDGAALRRADPETPLRPWLATMAKHVRLESVREWPEAGITPAVETSEAEAGAVPGWGDLDLSALTSAQREVWLRRMRGNTLAEIARDLDVSRAAVRDRLDRAVGRLRNGAHCDPDRSWALEMLRSGRRPRGVQAAEQAEFLLAAYASGETIPQIARALGVGHDAVRKRLRRWKTWWLG